MADEGLAGVATLFDGAAGDSVCVRVAGLDVTVACDDDTATAAQSGASLWPACAGLCEFLHEHWGDFTGGVEHGDGGRDGPVERRDGANSGATDATGSDKEEGGDRDGSGDRDGGGDGVDAASDDTLVVELGAGVGLLGCFVARRGAGDGVRVVSTDHSAAVLDTAAANAEANGVADRMDTQLLSWSAADAAALAARLAKAHAGAAAVVASEVVFAASVVRPLLSCAGALLRGLGRGDGAFWLGSSFRSPEVTAEVERVCREVGLEREVLLHRDGEQATAEFLLVERFRCAARDTAGGAGEK